MLINSEKGLVGKKRHTIKNNIISNRNKYILYLSKTHYGTISDYNLLKKDITKKYWLNKVKRVWTDSGYQGAKAHFRGSNIEQPHKKPRKTKTNFDSKLSQEQKEYNRFVSSNRVIIEHTICGIKKFRILYHVFRNKSDKWENDSILVCAGLHNFHILFNQEIKETA